MYRNRMRQRKKKEKEKEDSVRLRTGRTCERHILEAEILIRVRAVKFKF